MRDYGERRYAFTVHIVVFGCTRWSIHLSVDLWLDGVFSSEIFVGFFFYIKEYALFGLLFFCVGFDFSNLKCKFKNKGKYLF